MSPMPEAANTAADVEQRGAGKVPYLPEEGSVRRVLRHLPAVDPVQRLNLLGLILGALVHAIVVHGRVKCARCKAESATGAEIHLIATQLDGIRPRRAAAYRTVQAYRQAHTFP